MLFNIIYTHGTAKYLWLITNSILSHANINVRIICNDCPPEEIKFLKEKTHNDSRIELCVFGTDSMASHHEILNYIVHIDEGRDFFCFMDSDIFASGPFLDDMTHRLNEKSALFSCKPIMESQKYPEKAVNRLQGRHFHTSNGILVGGSYFAIYRREHLIDVMNRSGLGFDRKDWKDMDLKLQLKLQSIDMEYDRYDTAKLLNIFFSYYGYELEYYEHPNLHHIGGLSWSKSVEDPKGRPSNFNFSNFENASLAELYRKRRVIAKYFSDLIEAFIDTKPIPQPPTLDNQIEAKKLLDYTIKLTDIYKQ